MNQKELNINIYFEKEDYVISYNEMHEYFRLPDGRILEAKYWIETYPEQPVGLHVVTNTEDIDSNDICDLKIAPKNEVFNYEGKMYGVTNRMFMVQYIALPDKTVLEHDFPEENENIDTNEDILKYMKFKKVEVSLMEEIEKENIVFAELKNQ